MSSPFRFNKSVRVEVRPDKVTGDAGVLLCREVLSASGVDRWMSERIEDARDPGRIRHSLAELMRTACLLAAQGRRDHDDATVLRDDPAFRLAASERAGTTPLAAGRGLASQPTLSRLVAMLSRGGNPEVLREGLVRLAGWRLRARNGGRRLPRMVVDLDSLPIEVHGKQPGSEWSGYYKAKVYHPLVASVGERGDLLDARLRPGSAHTAKDGMEFVAKVLARVERHCCREAMVRMDAGYPAEPLMRGLEDRGTPFVARVKTNSVLDELAVPGVDEAALETWDDPSAEGEERTWFYEPEPYRAGTWSRARRVVCVLKERPAELFPEKFWLITSMSADEMPADELLALYRKRGKAEGHMGELKSVVDPALSSSPRPKRHYRGRAVTTRGPSVDAFACNEVRLLVALFGYQTMHVLRALLEQATQTGWSLRRLLERVLRAPARFTVSGRRVTTIVGRSARHWTIAAACLALLPDPGG